MNSSYRKIELHFIFFRLHIYIHTGEQGELGELEELEDKEEP